jgi:hypothetical protein
MKTPVILRRDASQQIIHRALAFVVPLCALGYRMVVGHLLLPVIQQFPNGAREKMLITFLIDGNWLRV